ncbi:MAG: pectin acetylesterase-family hydrolase [bacterium]|nr:pectin acetylesterase-family hydrolase [bacterium]
MRRSRCSRWTVTRTVAWVPAQAASQAPVAQAPAAQSIPGWEEVTPGPWAVCSDGSPFKFYVASGNPKRLVIFFQGGGACWDAGTCAAGIHRPRVELDELRAGQGIYARGNFDNPFRGWTFVWVPYCSADIFWGDAVRAYASGLTIHHRGATNARAALLWTYARVPDPEVVAVIGRSAGAYGSLMWAPHVMRRYANARVVQLGDVGAGVMTDAFGRQGFENWNIAGALPDWIPGVARLRSRPEALSVPQVYTDIARSYPRNTMSQFNTVLDGTQIFFYALMRGERAPSPATAAEWSRRMQASMRQIKADAPNFFSYTAPGGRHGILTFPEFYTETVGGVRFVDWLRQLLRGWRPGDVWP